MVRAEMKKLGRVTRGQRNVLLAFGVTVLLWVLPGFFALAGVEQSAFALRYARSMPEGVAAMVGALMLFVLPVDWRARRFTITWDDAVKIDWGIVLLYGGGLAVGELAFSTGLARAVGESVTVVAARAVDAVAHRHLHVRGDPRLGDWRRTPLRPT